MKKHFKRLAIALALLILLIGLMLFPSVREDAWGVLGRRDLEPLMQVCPRVAKIDWLERHEGQYERFVLGSERSECIPVDRLEKGYNLSWQGTSLQEQGRLVEYLLHHQQPKQIILCLDPSLMKIETAEAGPHHPLTSGLGPMSRWLPFLFNKEYPREPKIAEGPFPDRRIPETGVLSRPRSDSTPITDDLPLAPLGEPAEMNSGDLAALEHIVTRCRKAKVELDVLWLPLPASHPGLDSTADLIRDCLSITPCWNFLGNPYAQLDPYYDELGRLRADTGDAVLAQVLHQDCPIPEFGCYLSAEDGDPEIRAPFAPAPLELPILMYHAFYEEGEAPASTYVSADRFKEQLWALLRAGYTPVTLRQVQDYVLAGSPLPPRPVVLTADDGYRNNLELAAPILENLQCPMSIAVIGVSVGKDTYKDQNVPIIPHFSLEEVRPWVIKGVVEIISHTYDMHQVELDGPDHRLSVTRKPGEPWQDYVAALEGDFRRSKNELEQTLQFPVTALAYPNGRFSPESEIVARQAGFRLTMTIRPGLNPLLPGCGRCLRQMNRYWVAQNHTGPALLELISPK